MAYSSQLQYMSCQCENGTKYVRKWCTECEKGFCDECIRIHKGDRNHHVISVDDYPWHESSNVNLQCADHNKQLVVYCPIHDSVACRVCVQLKHVSCKDLKPLDEAAIGVKSSTALTDLEQTIDGLLENIEKGIRHLLQNKTYLREQEDVTKKSIAKKRAEINEHLDHLEKQLIMAINSKAKRASKEISSITSKLETKRERILHIKHKTQKMKQISSNLHAFIGIQKISEAIVDDVNAIKRFVSCIPELRVTVQINPKFDSFIEAFDSLGEIQIIHKEAVVPYFERRLIQAQNLSPAEPSVHGLKNLKLKLRTKFKIGEKNSNVTSCLILPNKSILIGSLNKSSLTLLREDGSHDCEISVPYRPYDVTTIDDQRVAVSYIDQSISIVNLKTQTTYRTLEKLCKQSIWGISYHDSKIYAVANNEGIKVIDLAGNISKIIRIYNDARSTFKITVQKDKIYYSVNNRSVHCVDMEGREIWTCYDDQLQTRSSSPAIAVDSYGITYAAGFKHSLLMAISPDGTQQKVLLTRSDGLQHPNAVYYDKGSKRLLVCNEENGHAALYDVMY